MDLTGFNNVCTLLVVIVIVCQDFCLLECISVRYHPPGLQSGIFVFVSVCKFPCGLNYLLLTVSAGYLNLPVLHLLLPDVVSVCFDVLGLQSFVLRQHV